MPNQVQSPFSAILDDDRLKVNALLTRGGSLAKDRVIEEDRYQSRIAHWIYAGDTALHVAAAGHRVEFARILLAAGADPGSAKNRRGSQPLHYAADSHWDRAEWNARRQVAMIRLLLKAGARIEAQDKNGATPLHRAVRTRSAAAARCLLVAGASRSSLGPRAIGFARFWRVATAEPRQGPGNLLIYAVNTDSEVHKPAKAWLESALSGDEPVALG